MEQLWWIVLSAIIQSSPKLPLSSVRFTLKQTELQNLEDAMIACLASDQVTYCTLPRRN